MSVRRSLGIVRYDTTEVGFWVQFHLPLRVELKDRVKAIAGARWVRVRKSWFVPASEARGLLVALHGHAFELDAASREAFERAAQSQASALEVDDSAWAEASEPARRVQSPFLQEAAAYRARQAKLSFEGGTPAAQKPAKKVAGTTRAPATPQRTAGEGARIARVRDRNGVRAGYPSVLALTQRVDAALRHALGAPQWVVGVVQGLTKSRQKHLYFRLKDVDPEIGADQAVLNVAIFGRTAERIVNTLQTHQLVLEEGMTLALCGQVGLYAPRSSLQLIANDVDVRVSRGEVELQRDRVVAALRKAGLSWKNTRLPLPKLPERIAIMTSSHGDALHDVMRTLAHGKVGAHVELVDIPVQGPDLEAAALKALKDLSARAETIDLLLIVRGGGAANELAWWDNVKVGEAVADCPIPVIVGIGHERDETALHEVARFEATPTAAAQCVAQLWQDARVRIADASADLVGVAEQVWDARHRELSQCAERFHHAADRQMVHAQMRVREVLSHDLREAVRRAFVRHDASLVRVGTDVVRHVERAQEEAAARCAAAADAMRVHVVQQQLRLAKDTLDVRAEQLQHRARMQLENRSRELHLADNIVRASDPTRLLRLGYALVRDQEGGIVRDAASLHAGDALRIELAQGRVHAVVQSTDTNAASPDAASDASSTSQK